jgi:hypothetical protein
MRSDFNFSDGSAGSCALVQPQRLFGVITARRVSEDASKPDTECGEFHAKIFDVIVRSGRTSIFCGNASRARVRGSWSDARASW